MGVVIIKSKVRLQDLEIAKQDYGDYIKIVLDIKSRVMAIGGEWHADAERQLLETGSLQSNLWGGGIDLVSKSIDFNSLINIRPGFNNSQEILDAKIRSIFEQIVKEKFIL